jgi:tocopherol O-methyltransferase
MVHAHPDRAPEVEAIRDHYDRLSVYYHALWGEHLHHGYWEAAASPREAQVRLTERLAARAGIRPGSHVLDIGCGVGGSSRWLAEHLGCSVLGITISAVQAAMATDLTRRRVLTDRVRFSVMDARDLEQLPAVFNAVWIVECSEHLPDKGRLLRDCARVLKPNGRLALCAWTAAEELSAAGSARLEAICHGMLCPSLATHGEYVSWLRDAGFVVETAEEVGPRVRETWLRCAEIARQGWIHEFLQRTPTATREFVATFSLMDEAYRDGSLGYGMFTACFPECVG